MMNPGLEQLDRSLTAYRVRINALEGALAKMLHGLDDTHEEYRDKCPECKKQEER